jgi:hypothetical protein
MKSNYIEKILKKIKEDEREYVTLDISTYKNIQEKARFIDSEYGEWWARPRNVLYHKQNHPIRAKQKGKRPIF